MRIRPVLLAACVATTSFAVLPSQAAACSPRAGTTVVTPKGATATLPTPGQPVAGSASGADTRTGFTLDLKRAKTAPVKVTVSWGSATSDFDIVVSDRFGFEHGRGVARNGAEQHATEVVVTAPLASCDEIVVVAKNVAGDPSEVLTATVAVGDAKQAKPVVLPRKGWTATGSPNGVGATGGGEDPAAALDGDLKTRWSSGMNQLPSASYTLDLGAPTTFSRLLMDTGPAYSADRPLEYAVQVSSDMVQWQTVAGGVGSATTEARFPVQTARYVRAQLTSASYPNYWSLSEINLAKSCFSAKAGC